MDLFTPATPPVTLTPIATGFNNPIGIDYHEPTDQVILSVNWPSGQANNFEIKAVNQRSIPEARRFIGRECHLREVKRDLGIDPRNGLVLT